MSDSGSHPGAGGVQHRQVAVFHQPEPVTWHFNDSEVAAWYTNIRVPPGDYPLMGRVEHGRVDRCTARLPGVIVDEYHAAPQGGVAVGSAPYVPRGLGQPAVYPLTMDGYGLAGLLAEHGGRTKDGWFELTDPALEIRSREMLTARWLPHTWSYCQTCGDYLGPMPAKGEVAAGDRERLFRVQEQRHQADSGCERPSMLHAGGGFVPVVGQWHELVDRDHRDPFTVVYLAAGQTFQTLAKAFETSLAARSITERVVYADDRPSQDRVLSHDTNPIRPLPARFAARHRAALDELHSMANDLGTRQRSRTTPVPWSLDVLPPAASPAEGNAVDANRASRVPSPFREEVNPSADPSRLRPRHRRDHRLPRRQAGAGRPGVGRARRHRAGRRAQPAGQVATLIAAGTHLASRDPRPTGRTVGAPRRGRWLTPPPSSVAT